MNERTPQAARAIRVAGAQAEDLPLKVVPDWDEQVQRASVVCRLIDRHLDHEAHQRRLALDKTRLMPRQLRPEQRVQMVTDVQALTRQILAGDR